MNPVQGINKPPDFAGRTQEFAIRVIGVCAALPETYLGQTLGHQLLRAGTSVGAHYAEANHSRSRADFLSKIDVARQEMQETIYWMKLILGAKLLEPRRLDPLLSEAHELLAILITMSNNARKHAEAKH